MDSVIVVIIVGIFLFLVVSKAWDWWTHSRIKARGVRTVGRVSGMRSESGTITTFGPTSGPMGSPLPVTVHTMSYEFDVEGRRFGPFKKGVDGSLAKKKAGDEIIVYYLPETPWEHTIT